MTASAVESPVRGLHIGGEWTAAEGGNTFEDSDPFSGDVVANVPAGTREDARRAIEAAAEAFPAWSETPPAARQQIFLKAPQTSEGGARLLAAPFSFHLAPMSPPAPDQSTGRSSRPTRARSRWGCGARSASSARSRRGTRR